MIQSRNITRRSFLAGLVYLGSFGFLPLSGSSNPRTYGDLTALASKLAEYHLDQQSARVVGLEYLRVIPSEAKAEVLIDLISSFDRERRAELAQADNRKLRELLQRRQRQDFEHGRVVNVRGWILSETECRLCALAALL